jgi:hypothetical protein
VIACEYSWKTLRTSTQRLAQRLLIGIAGLSVLLACGALVYLAYAYVSLEINHGFAPLLAHLKWWPADFDRPGDVVVIALIAALSYGLGKLTRRRTPPPALDTEARTGRDPRDGDPPPGSSQRGAAGQALPVAAE